MFIKNTMKGCVFEKKRKNKNQNEKGIENNISQSEESCFCYLRCDHNRCWMEVTFYKGSLYPSIRTIDFVYPSSWINLSRMNPYSRLQLNLLSTICAMRLCLL